MEEKSFGGINQLFVDLDGFEIDLDHIISVREIILNAPGVEKLRRIDEINFEDSIRVLKQLGNVCETFEKQLMADPQLRNSFIQERWKKPDRFLTSILTSLVKNNILPDKMKQENGRNLFFCTLKEFQSSMLSFLLELGLTNEEISEYGNATLTEVVNEMKAEGLVGNFKPSATAATSVVPPAQETSNISQTANTASDVRTDEGPDSSNIEASRKVSAVHSEPSQTNKVQSDSGEYSQECVSSLPSPSASSASASTNGNQASSGQPPPSYSFFTTATDCLPSTSSRPMSVSSNGNLIPLTTSMSSFQRPSSGAASRGASSVIPSFSAITNDDPMPSTSSGQPLPSCSSCTGDSGNLTPSFINPFSVSFNSSRLVAPSTMSTNSIQGPTSVAFPTAASDIISPSSAPSFSASTNLLPTSSTSSGQQPTDVTAALDNPLSTSPPSLKSTTSESLILTTTSKISFTQGPSSSTEASDIIPSSSAPNDDPTLPHPSDQQPPPFTAALGNLPISSHTFSASSNDNPSFGLPPPSYSTLTAASDLLPPSSSHPSSAPSKCNSITSTTSSSFPIPTLNSPGPSTFSDRQPPSYTTSTPTSASSAQSFSKPIIHNPTSPSSCLSFSAASEDKSTPTSSHPFSVFSNPNPLSSPAPYFPVFANPTSSSLPTSAIRRLPSYSSSTSTSGYFQPSSAPSFSLPSGDNPMTVSSIQISSYSTADSGNLPPSSAQFNPSSSSTASRHYPPTYSFVSSKPSSLSANTDSFPSVSGYNPQYSSSSVSFLKHQPTSASFSKPACHLPQSSASLVSVSGLLPIPSQSQASPRPSRSFLAPLSVPPLAASSGSFQSSYHSALSFSDSSHQSLITSPSPLPPSGNSPSSSTPYALSSESYQPPSYSFSASIAEASSPQPQSCQPTKTFSTLLSPSHTLLPSTSYTTSSNVYPTPSYHLTNSFSDASSLQYLSHQPTKPSASFLAPSCNLPTPNAYTASKSYQSPYPFAGSFPDASLQPHSRQGSENSTSVYSSKRCQPPSYPSGISGLPTTVVSSLKPESRRRKFNHTPSSSTPSTSTSNACSYFSSQPERPNPPSTWKEHSHRLKRRSSNSSRSSTCFVPPSSPVRPLPSVPTFYSPNRTNFASRLPSSVSHPHAHLSFSANSQTLPPPLYSAQHPSQLVSSFPSSNSHYLHSTSEAPSFAQISVTSSQMYSSFSSASPSAASFLSSVSTNASSGSANTSTAAILLPSSPEFLRPSSESPVTLDLDQFQI